MCSCFSCATVTSLFGLERSDPRSAFSLLSVCSSLRESTNDDPSCRWSFSTIRSNSERVFGGLDGSVCIVCGNRQAKSRYTSTWFSNVVLSTLCTNCSFSSFKTHARTHSHTVTCMDMHASMYVFSRLTRTRVSALLHTFLSRFFFTNLSFERGLIHRPIQSHNFGVHVSRMLRGVFYRSEGMKSSKVIFRRVEGFYFDRHCCGKSRSRCLFWTLDCSRSFNFLGGFSVLFIFF